jgi:hypothetical protein
VSLVEKFKEYGYINLGIDDDGMSVMGKHFENDRYMVVVIDNNKLLGMVRLSSEQLKNLTKLPKELIPTEQIPQ